MLAMHRFTTMSYRLPNWRLIYTSLLFVSILFTGCRSDGDIETQHASKLSPDELVAQTFHYTGSDQTLRAIMESIKQLPEAKGMAAHFSQVKARLVWRGVSHVGEVGVNETVYIPIHIQGEDEINWIWVIYLDHGTQISSEFLNRAEVYDDHLWLFDYLTQKGLGHVAKSGVYYAPPSGARSFRKVINGKLYECTRAHSFTVGNFYDDEMNVVDGGSSTRFHPENCVPVFSFEDFDHPKGQFSGPPVGFWGRFSRAESGNPGISPEKYTCIRYAPNLPPIIDEPTTPIGPILPPPCGEYRMKIQEPQMNSHIKKLFDYVRSEEAQDGIERAFIQLSDGSFKDIQGVKDAVHAPAEDVIGIMHTHVYRKNSSGTDGVMYSNQSFSLADIRSFVAHVSKSIAKELAKNSKTGSPVEIDLSKYYSGIVSKHGVYILSFNKKIKTFSEFIDLFGPVNSSEAASESAFQTLIEDQGRWITAQVDQIEGSINENNILAQEEQYILDHINEYYPSLKAVLGLMFFDLTKRDPEGFSVYDQRSKDPRVGFKKFTNRKLFYNRHDCK